MPEQKQDYALVVGINHYPRYGSKGRSLQGAIDDAQDFHDWLIDKSEGGALPPENCRLIRSSVDTLDPPQPRKGSIDDELESIQDAAKRSGARRLYFYFSGHGQTRSHRDVTLCMSNWARGREAAAISLDKYLDHLVECTEFQEIIVLLDCCRSRRYSARGQATELSCALPVANPTPKVLVAYAAEFQQTAREAPTGETTEEGEPVVRGHFTRALMSALRGAAASDEGGVTGLSLIAYLTKVVPRLARRRGKEQKPDFAYRSYTPGIDEIVFGSAEKVAEVDVIFNFSSQRTGAIRLEGPTLDVLREGEASGGPWKETLEPAIHLLTDLDSGEKMPVHLQEVVGEHDVQF